MTTEVGLSRAVVETVKLPRRDGGTPALLARVVPEMSDGGVCRKPPRLASKLSGSNVNGLSWQRAKVRLTR